MSDSPQPQELSTVKRALAEMRALRQKIEVLERKQNEPIAVIGMGLRFPGGAHGDVHDAESFWQLLRNGVDAITETPATRWDLARLFDEDPEAPGKLSTRYGGWLQDVDQFDAPFFGISRREAESMDPQQRILLEVTWEALENACLPPDQLFDSATGVFLGAGNSDYMRLMLTDAEQIDAYVTSGSALCMATGRLSYSLGLRGPSISLDTACSSSLVAIHMAMQSLRQGESDLALAGGTSLILAPELTINFSKANMMAPDGRCKTFDAAADGYVRSEGCAMIVLKRLRDALEAGDPVLAVLRGSAVNQDGRSGGITAPNGPAQEDVIRSALANAGVHPHAVSYVETHGTGTPLGDPIEVGALAATLGRDRSADAPLVIGSVKTNLGHLEATAGIAGVIKTILALQHKEIPPHLHLTELNPHIAAMGQKFVIPTETLAWQTAATRIAGVSSFGLSGTNAHVIIEEAPIRAHPVAEVERPQHLFTLSAKSMPALRALAQKYAEHLAAHPEQALADVAYSANHGRAHFRQRLALAIDALPALQERLAAFGAGGDAGMLVQEAPVSAPEVVFLFTGHGSHYAGMGRALYDSQPVFRAALDRCDALLRPMLDRTLTEILFADAPSAGEASLLARMDYAQPALFALQIALAELWQSWGVQPAAVAGHSAGEYAAAVVAGVLSLEDGLRLICARGRLMHTLPRDDEMGGEMVALFLPEDEVARAIAPYAATLGIAAVNGPATTVVSGDKESMRALLAELSLDADDMRRLDVDVAAHSPLIEPILAEFARSVAGVTLRAPQITLVSSMTGKVVSDEVTDPDYWVRHLRQPVRFADVFATLRAEGFATFVEVGPHPTLLGMGKRIWQDDNAVWAASLHREHNGWDEMLVSLALLYVNGVEVNWQGFDAPYARRKIALPTYAWQRESHWAAAAQAAMHALPRVAQLAPVDKQGAAWEGILHAAQAQAEQGPLDLNIHAYPTRWDVLDRLAQAYTIDALRALDLFTDTAQRFTVDELLAHASIASTYHHLIGQWLDDLVADGLLARDGNGDGAYHAPAPLPAPDWKALNAEAAATLSEVAPLLAYIQRCGARLAEVITGREDALNTLFPDGSYETVDYLYNGWAVPRYFNAIVRSAVAAVAQARPTQPLRVLEIGAGTGGTSATVLPALPAARTTYTFTDVSDFFLTRAAERFAAYPFVQYTQFNIETPGAQQGLTPHSYDVIVASNVLHATRDLDATLRHALEMLAPGGALVLYEATRHPRWFGVTTGLIEGWQRFEDQWRTDQPLLAVEDWQAALQANGFDAVVALPGAEQPTALLGQHVILARAPIAGASMADEAIAALPALAHAANGALATDATAKLAAPSPSAEALKEALATALADERSELLLAFVRQTVARVLRMREWQNLQRDQPMLDLGFDSLMAIELRNLLRQGLDLPGKLPATLIFDYPTIGALAAYLDRTLAGAAKPAKPQPAPAPRRAETPASATDVAALSDEEMEILLLKKLGQL